MKEYYLTKFFQIGIILIVIFTAIHIYLTVKDYNSILTALPLRIRVAFVLAFWILILIVCIVVYCLLLKHCRK